MARKRVTIRDVANRAGVSPTTVSFVLNDVQGPNLRDETRRRVLDAAQTPVDGFLPQMLYSLNSVSRDGGFRVLMEPIEDIRRPEAYLDLVHSR